MQVIKRDGRKVLYSSFILLQAILKTLHHTKQSIPELGSIIAKMEKHWEGREEITVDEIQNVVEDVLMKSKYKNVAKAYIEYRKERDIARESGSKLLKDIESFIDQSSDEFLKENANKAAGVVSTHRDLLAGILSRHIALTQLLPKDVVEAHMRGVIHAHDTDYSPLSPLTNCSLVNYEDMLENGFKIGDAQISKPKSIGVAATILTQIAQAVSSSQYGGQSHAHIDSGLAQYVKASEQKIWADAEATIVSLFGESWNTTPYNHAIRVWSKKWIKEKLQKEVYDAMQSLLYQINTLTTSNGQTPFITISLGLDTSYYGRMITEQYLRVHMEGIGENKATPMFPKVIFFLEDGVNLKEGDPNYDLKKLAVECSSKRIYPDYVSVPKNKEITKVEGAPVTPMSCRSYLSSYKDEDGNEKLNGRFNLGVVSLNLPYIVYEAGMNLAVFTELLDKYAELCYTAHMARVERLKGTKAKQNPIMWMQGALARLEPEETIDKLFYNGYASISLGYVGLHECLDALEKGESVGLGKEIAQSILKFLKSKCEEFSKRSGISFSVYGTPSESLCYKAAKAIKRDFPEACFEKDYVTNSFHVPVWKQMHPMDKWGYENGFAEISSGGNISYIETPNLSKNLVAYEGLLDYAYNIGLHYFAINTPVDRCFKCGYEGEFTANIEGYVCSSCGNKDGDSISVLRRVSGYISAPNSRPFNKGKQSEVIDRTKHC